MRHVAFTIARGQCQCDAPDAKGSVALVGDGEYLPSRLYENFADGMIKDYLAEEGARCSRVPIVRNPKIAEHQTAWTSHESIDVPLRAT